MKTELVLAESLKNLMSKESLDEISVKRLVETCGIRRQTFYYHFRDIYDLLTWIFLNEKLESKKVAETWQDAVRIVMKYVIKNKKFIQNTLSSAGRDLFVQFIFSYLYSFTLKYFTKADEKNFVANDDKRFYVTYFASGITHALLTWIDKGMKETEEKVINNLQIVIGDYVLGIINRYKTMKKD